MTEASGPIPISHMDYPISILNYAFYMDPYISLANITGVEYKSCNVHRVHENI
jgi:hypothetical protein